MDLIAEPVTKRTVFVGACGARPSATGTANSAACHRSPLGVVRLQRRAGARLVWAFVVLVALFLGGCGGTTPAATPSPVATPTETPAPTATPIPNDYFQNPVLKHDFPDPGLIEVDETYYAYATNASGRNVQRARSDDLVNWDLMSDALPALPTWANLRSGFVWAPEVIKIDDQYVMYYTARDKEADKQCIGVATSEAPDGAFTDSDEEPFICQADEGGSIDASPFRDTDGTLYLYWKNDGNCCAMATYIYVQELAPDGLSLVGEPTRLVRNDAAWEGALIEAPTMWQHDDTYYLFFSANSYAGVEYAVGYAVCETATGPCEDSDDNPILASLLENPPVIGPGHQTIVVDDAGQTWLVYHAWEVTARGRKGTQRFMWIDQLVWEAGTPVVDGPTTDPQPMPDE